MRYRDLGRTGLKVSAVGFGCIKFREIPENEAVGAVRRAVELGVNFFDTARSYHDSEEKLGKAIRGIRDRVIISSKTYARDAQGAWEHIQMSREKLGIENIDIYLLHSVSDGETYRHVTSPGGALEALEEAKQKGVIRHIGTSIHRDLGTMEDAIRSGKFEMVMLAYSPLDQEGVGARILPMAKEHGVGVVVMKRWRRTSRLRICLRFRKRRRMR
ncbi:MAG TPA: aldo/keto reductase [Candidatus Latescibacteria bacterium]|nr:aldo/keto reductase [Candidatus Latescibacterota bacterium]